MRTALDRWLVWCASEGVNPSAATPAQLADCILDHKGLLPIDDLVDLSADPTGRHAVRRKTCCLAFTLPTPSVCAGCCINAGSPAGGRPSAGSNPIT